MAYWEMGEGRSREVMLATRRMPRFSVVSLWIQKSIIVSRSWAVRDDDNRSKSHLFEPPRPHRRRRHRRRRRCRGRCRHTAPVRQPNEREASSSSLIIRLPRHGL